MSTIANNNHHHLIWRTQVLTPLWIIQMVLELALVILFAIAHAKWSVGIYREYSIATSVRIALSLTAILVSLVAHIVQICCFTQKRLHPLSNLATDVARFFLYNSVISLGILNVIEIYYKSDQNQYQYQYQDLYLYQEKSSIFIYICLGFTVLLWIMLLLSTFYAVQAYRRYRRVGKDEKSSYVVSNDMA